MGPEHGGRWDIGVPDAEYLTKQKRTLQSFYKNFRKKEKGCNHLPLIKIDPDYIIPDELHLLLRITDVLLHNLISAAKIEDKKTSPKARCLELKEGPMIKALTDSIQSCGVTFSIWEKDGNFEFTSIMGDDKKKLLKMLPPKLISCQPPAFSLDVKKLWEDFGDLYSFITSRNPAAAGIEYKVLHCKAKEWLKSFWKLGRVCAGYKPCNVTPYMHIMAYHVPDLIRRHGNIKQFSCQGVEQNNDACKTTYFKSSNKWNATSDILLHERKMDHLTHHAKKKRKYNKENNPEYWTHGIKEARAKRRRKE